MRKKILLLGGSHGQIPAIKEAKKRGLYTILCDYLPDNPGKNLADKFYLVSTTDKEKVLGVALENDIDYVLAYGSDPATLTAAYVKEKMGIRGNSTESIELLTHKDLFRQLQKENQFPAPEFLVLTERKELPHHRVNAILPAVVKPVDASDTKGVTMIENISELEAAVDHAFKFTRCGRVIIEEKVGCEVARLNGDGFVIGGELKFCAFGDHLYTSDAAPLKPSCTLFPSKTDEKKLQKVTAAVKQIIKKSGYLFGPMNIEARINARNEIYIMELGPRNGGNHIPTAICHSTGFNMLQGVFNLLLNEEVIIPKMVQKPAIIFTLHSNSGGVFDSFEIDNEIQPFVVEKHLYIKPGHTVNPYNKPGSSLGALIFCFKTMEEVNNKTNQLYQKVMNGVRL